jgi:hypothetical protein
VAEIKDSTEPTTVVSSQGRENQLSSSSEDEAVDASVMRHEKQVTVDLSNADGSLPVRRGARPKSGSRDHRHEAAADLEEDRPPPASVRSYSITQSDGDERPETARPSDAPRARSRLQGCVATHAPESSDYRAVEKYGDDEDVAVRPPHALLPSARFNAEQWPRGRPQAHLSSAQSLAQGSAETHTPHSMNSRWREDDDSDDDLDIREATEHHPNRLPPTSEPYARPSAERPPVRLPRGLTVRPASRSEDTGPFNEMRGGRCSTSFVVRRCYQAKDRSLG